MSANLQSDPLHGLVCTSCGSLVVARRVTPGSLGVELLLWLGGLATLVFVIGFFVLLGAIGYSIWRIAGRYNACPVCGGRHLVPKTSPVGLGILNRQQPGQPT